jgi:hypothetical protein
MDVLVRLDERERLTRQLVPDDIEGGEHRVPLAVVEQSSAGQAADVGARPG